MNKKQVFEILNRLGVSCDLKGRDYIESAIEMVYENSNISVTQELYPAIAKVFNDRPQNVERAIRHAIECAFNNPSDYLVEVFGNTIIQKTGKLTSTQFIWGLVKYLKVMCEE